MPVLVNKRLSVQIIIMSNRNIIKILAILSLANMIHAYDICDSDNLVAENINSYKYSKEPTKNCGCNSTNCIRKCCAIGFSAKMGVCERNIENETYYVPIYRNKYFLKNVTLTNNLIIGSLKHCDFYPLIPEVNADDMFYLQQTHRLWIPNESRILDNADYCLEFINSSVSAFVCFAEPEATSIDNARTVCYVGMIISTPFLLATLIAYALLPDRNLHMKALMSYVFNLLMGYILLVSIQLSQHFSELGCSTIAFCCVFFFMASFFWMNVICIDIWLGFSGLRQISGMKTAETKRFLYYCLYAWGMAVLLVLAVILIDKYAPHDSWYHPEVGRAQCFIRDGTPQLLYFYGPMGIVITINVILFALTALKIRKVKKDTSMLKHSDSKRHSYESDKQRFNLYLKLLFAMGVNWSMELISWAVNLNVGLPQYIWYFTDFCNAVYGVFIFFIFVFKKNIWRQLKRRYYSFMGKPHFAHSMTTNPTSVTSYSTTVSNHDNANTDTSELTTRIS